MLNYNTNRIEKAYKESNFKKDIMLSFEYNFLKTTFLMYISFQEVMDYMEKRPSFDMVDKRTWIIFVQKFYTRFNLIENIFSDYIDGTKKDLSVNDKKDISESLLWIKKVTCDTFPIEKREKQTDVFDAFVAGVYYSSLFYYMKKIDQFLFESIIYKSCEKDMLMNGYKEELNEISQIVKAIQQEANYLGKIEDVLNEKDVLNITKENQENLFFMWHRTNVMIHEQLDKECEELISKV